MVGRGSDPEPPPVVSRGVLGVCAFAAWALSATAAMIVFCVMVSSPSEVAHEPPGVGVRRDHYRWLQSKLEGSSTASLTTVIFG
jgi:hypothetical protein